MGLDDPYGHLGGDPHPIITGPDTVYPPFGAIGTIDPNINSPRVQSWNVTIERQFAGVWQGAVSYLGRYSDRLWGTTEQNPGTFLRAQPLHDPRAERPRPRPSAGATGPAV